MCLQLCLLTFCLCRCKLFSEGCCRHASFINISGTCEAEGKSTLPTGISCWKFTLYDCVEGPYITPLFITVVHSPEGEKNKKRKKDRKKREKKKDKKKRKPVVFFALYTSFATLKRKKKNTK